MVCGEKNLFLLTLQWIWCFVFEALLRTTGEKEPMDRAWRAYCLKGLRGVTNTVYFWRIQRTKFMHLKHGPGYLNWQVSGLLVPRMQWRIGVGEEVQTSPIANIFWGRALEQEGPAPLWPVWQQIPDFCCTRVHLALLNWGRLSSTPAPSNCYHFHCGFFLWRQASPT